MDLVRVRTARMKEGLNQTDASLEFFFPFFQSMAAIPPARSHIMEPESRPLLGQTLQRLHLEQAAQSHQLGVDPVAKIEDILHVRTAGPIVGKVVRPMDRLEAHTTEGIPDRARLCTVRVERDLEVGPHASSSARMVHNVVR